MALDPECFHKELRHHWVPRLAILAFAVSFVAVFVALTIMLYARQCFSGKIKFHKAYWVFVASAGMSLGGAGVWITMLVDMEALELKTCRGNDIEKRFNAPLLLSALVAAVSAASTSLHLATPRNLFIEDARLADRAEAEFDRAKTLIRLVSETTTGETRCTWRFELEHVKTRTLLASTMAMSSGMVACHYAMVFSMYGAFKVEYEPGHVIGALLVSLVSTTLGVFLVTQVSAKENLEKMKVRIGLRLAASFVISGAITWLQYESMEAAHFKYTGRKGDAATQGWGPGQNVNIKAYRMCLIALFLCVAQLGSCQHFSAVLYRLSQEAIKKATARLPDNVQEVLDRIYAKIKDLDDGEVASYIPELARADPENFGVALCDVDGKLYTAGDARKKATIQSACKPLMYALAMKDATRATVARKIGEEPSGQPFDAVAIDEDGRAYNPLINTGAIVSASLINGAEAHERLARFEKLVQRCVHEPGEVALNEKVFRSEMATNATNQAIVAALVDAGIVDASDAETSLDAYTRMCSLDVTAADLAVMGATFANGGKNPLTKVPALSPALTQAVVTVMMSCGMYNGAGKWMVDVGIPAKSGVSGLLLCVVPGTCGIGVYSPALDCHGNSTRGVLVAEAMSKDLKLHVLKAACGNNTDGVDRRSMDSLSSFHQTSFRQNSSRVVPAESLTPDDETSHASGVETPRKVNALSDATAVE